MATKNKQPQETGTITFMDYEQRNLALCEQIAHYEQDIANHQAQIAVSKGEISRLKYEQQELRTHYACAEFDKIPQRGLCGNIIEKEQ